MSCSPCSGMRRCHADPTARHWVGTAGKRVTTFNSQSFRQGWQGGESAKTGSCIYSKAHVCSRYYSLVEMETIFPC